MTLLHYASHACTMCGHRAPVESQSAAFRYCESECRPDHRNGFVDAHVAGSTKRAHLHRTCTRCGYTWLTETSAEVQAPDMDPGQQAMAMVRTVAAELQAAGSALDQAAEAIKNGRATPLAANQAKQAATRAKAAAEGLVRPA